MHPLATLSSISIGRPYAAVSVVRQGKKLIIQPGQVFVAKADARFAELPSDFKVVDEDGNLIIAEGKFLISTDTIDPLHAVVDYSKR